MFYKIKFICKKLIAFCNFFSYFKKIYKITLSKIFDKRNT